MDNPLLSLLIRLGICTPDTIEQYYPRVRDRADVHVLRCRQSGVMFLSRADHITDEYYQAQTDFSYWAASDRQQALAECYTDDVRRANQLGTFIRNRRWVDVGAGAGGVLDLLKSQAREACAVEPQATVRQVLEKAGHQVYAEIVELPEAHFDVATLFHVLEHLPDPVTTLAGLARKLAPGAYLIVEVPHANDALLTLYESEDFKAFTFWSEHLILHTRRSLQACLEAAGFTNIVVQGFQRYPLANHLRWLAQNRPGGHVDWAFLVDSSLDEAYGNLLARLDKTDTLIAFARIPQETLHA